MKSETIKRIILYVFASTGVVIFLLSVYDIINGEGTIDTATVLQIIGANTVITIGLLLLQKIESRYAILEVLLDIGYMNVVIVIFGVLFNWYTYIPVWIPVTIVVITYILFYLLDILRVRKDIDEINKLLKKTKEK